MKISVSALAAAASVALSWTCFANVASATPMANALAMKSAVPTNVETVRWGGGFGGRGWGGRGWGWGIGGGLLAGAIVGGALAAPYYGYGYGYGYPYYGYGYGYPSYGYPWGPRYPYYGYRPWRRW